MPPASFEIEKICHPELTGVPIAPAFGAMGGEAKDLCIFSLPATA
jgi:hypothetical protein